jgi:hypothetical protein
LRYDVVMHKRCLITIFAIKLSVSTLDYRTTDFENIPQPMLVHR